jgi:hypothetical protein
MGRLYTSELRTEKVGQTTYSRTTYRENWADYMEQHYVLRKLGRLDRSALGIEKIGQIPYSSSM